MLAGLGMFVFDAIDAPFDELARRRAWRHARTDRIGARAAGQFLGPGDDEVTISGCLVPGLAGRATTLDQLAGIADTGEAQILADGMGRILGSFTIEGIDETRRHLTDTGQARMIDFTITLHRAD